MDQVTQSTAAGAEQTAAAAEQMDAQAGSLQVQVAELRALIGRSSADVGPSVGIRAHSENLVVRAPRYRRPPRPMHPSNRAIPMPGDRAPETLPISGSEPSRTTSGKAKMHYESQR